MANSAETGNKPWDIQLAGFVKEKSKLIGGAALITWAVAVAAHVPSVASVAFKVGVLEAAQWGAAKVYEVFRAPKKQPAYA